MNKNLTTWGLLPLLLGLSFQAQSKMATPKLIAASQPMIEFNITDEINTTMANMLANIESPVQAKNIAKQLTNDSLKLRTNALVNDVDNQLPQFKFKVVIAE